ncbi:predicted protein [Histoplasma capsulatum G186AR]|uniref:Uncharacterized protein n=1 Tax=Ajellomyces capsulatus (strain G186AR / H82 / ATCC MYA-2454 / RMSCC 2432) TaxID=447093 RepID=C0NAQ0_AJECG|nr:uncharacterized protein HCBG_00196 [Histoplasma capsulatum G186AR]EEH10741.1 predicted protein [Histoplasma capsulatum G186AR]
MASPPLLLVVRMIVMSKQQSPQSMRVLSSHSQFSPRRGRGALFRARNPQERQENGRNREDIENKIKKYFVAARQISSYDILPTAPCSMENAKSITKEQYIHSTASATWTCCVHTSTTSIHSMSVEKFPSFASTRYSVLHLSTLGSGRLNRSRT